MSDDAQGPLLNAAAARRTARNIGALVLASIFGKGLLFLWQILLANWLGPEQNGVYTTVVSLMAVGTSLASFGMGIIAIREVARNPARVGDYWAAMLTWQTFFALLAYLGALALGWLGGYTPLILAYTAIAALSLIIDIFGNISSDLLIAQERMIETSLVDITHIVLRVGLAALALALGWGLLGVYFATILAGLGRSIALSALNARAGLRPRFPVAPGLSRHLLSESAPLAFTAFLTLAYQHLDKLLTTAIIGERSTGYLGPAFTINFGVIEVLSTTVLVATYPLMARAFATQGDLFGFLVEKLARFTLLICLPITLALSLYADFWIGLIFQPEYAPTAGILRILIWYTLITMVGNVTAQAFMAQNRQRRLMLLRAIGLLLNLALTTLALLRFRDPRGAAAASVLSELLIVSLMFLYFAAPGWAVGRVLRSFGRVLLLGLGAALLMLALGGIHPLLGLALGWGAYGLGVLLGRVLQPDDWDLLYRLVAAMPGGALIRRYWRRDVALNW